MKALGRYDGTLQMFVEEPVAVDTTRLEFLRWLAENGKLEHKVAGASGGAFNPNGPQLAEIEDNEDDWRIPAA